MLRMREEALLAQVRVLTEKHEALAAATGQNFNLFKILGRETDEVHTHSAILAELLNPAGSHGQGPVFARLFAKRFKIPAEGIERAQVRCEKTIGKGNRADILIEMDDTCVVVENKIYANDQPRQLERYHEYAKKSLTHRLMYLTLHGDDPSEDSLGELQLEDVERISYEQDVLEWLDDCIKEVARVPQIREILSHYQALLRKLTGKSTGELIVELKDLLKRPQGDAYNFEVAANIAEAMTALSVETEWSFWKTLQDKLQDKLQDNMLETDDDCDWGLQNVASAEFVAKKVKEVDEDAIRNAHYGGRHNYGWSFRVKSQKHPERYCVESDEVLLRIQCDGGDVYYGFIVVKKTPEGLRRLSRSQDKRLFLWGERLCDQEEGWNIGDGQWPAWGYPYGTVSLRKQAGSLSPKTMRRLMEKEESNSVVSEIVRSIHDTIDLIEGWEVSLDSVSGEHQRGGG